MSIGRSMGRCRGKTGAAGLGMVAVLLLCAFSAGSARAATWTGRQVGEATLFGMSCPTASMCVGVGSGNVIVSSTEPLGGAAGWNPIRVAESETLSGYFSVAQQIRAVDCPSTGFCVAVGYEGLVYTSTDPTGGPSAWSPTDLNPSGPNTHMYGLSCPTVSFCAAAAGRGKILTTTNPAGGASAWTVAQLPETLELRAISCPSAGFCVAVGKDGQILSSTSPRGGPTAWNQAQLPGAAIDRDLLGVSCPGEGLCASGNSIGAIYTSTSPTGPAGSWSGAQGAGTVQITALDCPSPTQCAAIDNNADVLTSTDPTGGPPAWTFANLLPFPLADEADAVEANGTFGLSCPSASLCAIGGARGRIFTSANPFDPPPAAPVQKKGKKRKGHGPKHPRALIGSHPPPGTETSGKTAKVRFRFFVANHASVRGYACRLDQRPERRCRSPKTYRAGVGIHRFRVRAIGWSGSKGPPAVVRFEVCHPTRIGLCIGPSSRRWRS
jgi:hypothetical protein